LNDVGGSTSFLNSSLILFKGGRGMPEKGKDGEDSITVHQRILKTQTDRRESLTPINSGEKQKVKTKTEKA